MKSVNLLPLLEFLAIFGSVVFAQNGAPCHKDVFLMMPRHSLNLTAFQGVWYSHEYASSHIGNTPAPNYKCQSINLAAPNASNPLEMDAAERYIDLETDQIRTGVGYVSVNDSRSPLSAVWTLEDVGSGQIVDMIILAADLQFSNWHIMYSCQHIGEENYRWETVTAFTRSRTLDPELRQFLKALMVGTGFRIGDHQPVSQQDCR